MTKPVFASALPTVMVNGQRVAVATRAAARNDFRRFLRWQFPDVEFSDAVLDRVLEAEHAKTRAMLMR